MARSVVIVESIAKTKTIKNFGKKLPSTSISWTYQRSSKNKLGVNIEDGFEPHTSPFAAEARSLVNWRKLLRQPIRSILPLIRIVKGKQLPGIFRRDQDKNNRIKRVLFNEITERAVLEAIENSQTIDINKVEAQKARRVMDRLVGYQ